MRRGWPDVVHSLIGRQRAASGSCYLPALLPHKDACQRRAEPLRPTREGREGCKRQRPLPAALRGQASKKLVSRVVARSIRLRGGGRCDFANLMPLSGS